MNGNDGTTVNGGGRIIGAECRSRGGGILPAIAFSKPFTNSGGSDNAWYTSYQSELAMVAGAKEEPNKRLWKEGMLTS
jgi:hypothetical protein